MEDWKIKLAIARMMTFRIPQDAWADTMQELAIVIHRFRYEPAKAHAASEQTILCRALDNRIRTLARNNARRQAMLERLAQIPESPEDLRTPDHFLANKQMHQALATLTPQQRAICDALMDGQSVYEIARSTGRHYETVRRHVCRIRKVLIERGLQPWPA